MGEREKEREREAGGSAVRRRYGEKIKRMEKSWKGMYKR